MRIDRAGGAVFLVTLAALAVAARAQRDVTAAAQTRSVVAGDHYRAGSIHRFLLGNDYRHLWTAPIEVPVLDLREFAGGLTPVRRVGGQQTLGLAMKGADGRDYTFRGIDKDPSEILPPEFHGTFVDRLLQDQIASSFPGGAVAVPPLLRAAGVLHSEPVLVVLPDDPLLGEFRPVFGGLLGTFEEFPRAPRDGLESSFGAEEIINGAEMWKRMDESAAVRPDARAFLTARLVDLLIGDWGRHRGQWRWAKLPDRERWLPIPEDRDQAFVRFEGLIIAAGRIHQPQFVSFGPEYPGIEGLTWNGRDGDRRILVDLEKSVWDEVARDVQSAITDEVIAEAVSRLPASYRALEGAAIETALRARRDALPEIADRFYRFLARDVDVRLTDRADVVAVERRDDGGLRVTVAPAEGGALYYRRTFHPGETDEVRIYLGGGADSVVATGGARDITVRVIGGDGEDVVDDRAGGGLRVSDADVVVLGARGTRLDARPYTPPRRETAPWIPPRDWGRRTVFWPWIGGGSDLGVFFSLAVQSEGYGFRKDPYADRHTVRLSYATRAGGAGGEYRGTFRRENRPSFAGLHVRASALDFLHFYGFGNETSSALDEDFYKVKQSLYVVEPSLSQDLGRGWTAHVRVNATYAKTKLESNRFIASNRPYGAEDFVQLGAGAGLSIDTRESVDVTARGARVTLGGAVFPEAGDVVETFGAVHGEAALYQPIPAGPTPVLAARVGGKRVWGAYPYHEAAYVGGSGTLRGFPRQRFAGDASLFASAEIRVPLARVYIFFPGRMGVFALGDVGRVYLEGESSKKWHTGAGGGLWLSLIGPENTASVAIASSEEGTRVYVLAGLEF